MDDPEQWSATAGREISYEASAALQTHPLAPAFHRPMALGIGIAFVATLASQAPTGGAASAKGAAPVEVFLVAALSGDVPADGPVEALLGEPVTIHAVVQVGRGHGARYYSDAPVFRHKGRRVQGRAVGPLSPLGARLAWWRVEPQQHHVKTLPPNQGNPAYSNAVLFGPKHGSWLGFDTIEYHETRIEGATRPRLEVRRASPTHPRLQGHAGLGTLRYKVTVEWMGTTYASRGAEATSALGIRSEVLRVSYRESDDFIGYLTSYYNVPNVFGSAGPGTAHQTERYQGADCADVLVGAARRAGARLSYTDVLGLRHVARAVTPRLLVDARGITYADGPRRGQAAALRFGSDVQRGDLMLIDYVGWDGSSRTWDHVAAVARDAGKVGWFDPRDKVMHMGYLFGLVEATVAADGPAIVQLLRFHPRHQWAFRYRERQVNRERARRRARCGPACGARPAVP